MTTQFGNAQATSTLSFHGVSIDINFTYPEEAHPQTEIFHNITLIAKTTLALDNFTLTIYAPINQSLEKIITPTITSSFMIENQTLPIPVNFTTPMETSGRLFCSIYVSTSQSSDYFFTSFYTTQVNTITFSELLVSYDQLLSDYANRLTLYQSLLRDYTDLSNAHTSLEKDYLLETAAYETLLANYTLLNSTLIPLQTNHTTLLNNYDSLNQDYNNLQDDIDTLEQEIKISQDTLNTDRNLMVIFIIILVGLIGLIIYLRNKQKEPYVVIRKETVSMKPEKK